MRGICAPRVDGKDRNHIYYVVDVDTVVVLSVWGSSETSRSEGGTTRAEPNARSGDGPKASDMLLSSNMVVASRRVDVFKAKSPSVKLDQNRE